MNAITPGTERRLGFFTRLLDDAAPGERYRLAAEQIRHAEAHGFTSAWVAQHHFRASEGGLPAPLVFLSHVAAQTSRIRLGTGIITLPLEDPLRVAEDAAVLELLSGGRLEIGVGSGGTASSFAAFGRVSSERGRVFGEHLAVLRAALAGETVGEGEALYPPAAELTERIWQATFSMAGGERAGAAGDGLMLSRTQPRPEGQPNARLDQIQSPIIAAYREALAARNATVSGVDARSPRIMASRTLFVADDRDEARRYAEVGLRRAAVGLKAAGHSVGGDSLDDLIAAFDTHVGTVDDVLESLSTDHALDAVSDVVFQVHSVDPPHELVLRSIELIGTKIAPALGLGTANPARQTEGQK